MGHWSSRWVLVFLSINLWFENDLEQCWPYLILAATRSTPPSTPALKKQFFFKAPSPTESLKLFFHFGNVCILCEIVQHKHTQGTAAIVWVEHVYGYVCAPRADHCEHKFPKIGFWLLHLRVGPVMDWDNRNSQSLVNVVQSVVGYCMWQKNLSK